MGYSIAARVKSKDKAERMIRFVAKNYRPWSSVLGKGKSISASEVTDDLSYDSAKTALGFDYASHLNGWERIYVYSALRWICLKIGVRKRRFKSDAVTPNIFEKAVPFMVYDGYESWPI